MANRRLIPLLAAFLILVAFYVLILWLSHSYLLGLSHDEEQQLSTVAVASRLTTTGFRTGQHVNRLPGQLIASGVHEEGHAVCGGCYHAVAKPEENIRCGFLIHQRMVNQENELDLLGAALSIATNNEFQEVCAQCHPDACSTEEKIYWRYDAHDKLPPIVSSSVPNLASIPSSQKMPAAAFANLTAFFAMPIHAVPVAGYVFDYNPSIVIIPQKMLDGVMRNMFLGSKSETNIEQDVPVYVASFRVSTQQSCFHPYETQAMYGGSWDQKPPVQDYLAIALLRSDLSIIVDVVVDVKASGIFQTFAEDFRLFVLDDQLYVASYDLIAPLRITTKPTHNGQSSQPAGDQDGDYIPLKNVYPSKMALSMRSFPSCPVCHNRPNKRCGKNLNYFSASIKDTNAATGSMTMVELWPSGPHVVQQVNLQQPCRIARQATEESIEMQTFSDAALLQSLMTSWHTMEEVMFPYMEPTETILTRGRGGACCVSVQHPKTGEELLVGIYHTKIPKFGRRSGKRLPLWKRADGESTAIAPNQYLSRWYAFKPTRSFHTVAQSGLFCLGYPDAYRESAHPLIKTTLWKKMIFGGDGKIDTGEYSLALECPRIHFVSGMSDKAGDASKVIVAYGVNDCFSRLIELDKASIVKALFPTSSASST